MSSTAVTSVETSTLKGRYGGQMRGDKGKRGEGERDRGESVGDRGRIVRILERHGDGRRGDTVVGLSWTWRAGEGEREGERESEKRGNEAGREARARRDLLPISFSRNSGAARTASTKRFRSFDIPNPPWLVLVLFDRPSVAFVAALKRRVFALSRSDVAN